MAKRTQAHKLAEIMKYGLLQYEESGEAQIRISFTPNVDGMDKFGIPYISMWVHSPYEVVDVVYFEYLQRGKGVCKNECN